MKKLFAGMLSVMLVMSLSACGNADNSEIVVEENSEENISESVTEENSEETAPDTAKSDSEQSAQAEEDSDETGTDADKTLVVYFSASGNTKSIAEYIVSETGSDIFEITPAEPYTDDDLDWTNPDSRVSREHDDESLRDVELTTTTVENWEEYDTVFIGYPIWWGIASWAVDGFVKANDFTDKTVIPFCTSSSSGIGESGKLLADEAGTGNWLDGQRFQSGADESTVKEWLDSLGT